MLRGEDSHSIPAFITVKKTVAKVNGYVFFGRELSKCQRSLLSLGF